ncbi:MFS transporter [Paenalkalicoccus suaedae]|uniref:MFS transporter n=1 Tax=Paenalkalicoccus suaedae TaxID=2592382 RepID=A0A859FJS2_9BACI|nr:MFS transporter [Paenalkalicoccus suaedae]QKS73036.1 MFS transporter [Paenalkalicoccus suaedae]
MKNKTLPTLWNNKPFLRIFSSYTVSMFGRWFDMVAIMILFSFVWQLDPLYVALIPVAYALPHALLSQFVGQFVDRFNNITLMAYADICTAILTIFLIFAPNHLVALPLILMRAAVTVIHFPAQQSLIKHIVQEQHIVKAVTWNGTVNELSKVLGPFIGGILAGYFSPGLCIFIGACAYFFSALIIIQLRKRSEFQKPDAASHPHSNVSFWKSWKDGWVAVLRNYKLKWFFGISLVGLMAIQMMDVQVTVLLRSVAPDRPELIGWVMSGSGFGALSAIIIINQMNTVRFYGVLLGISYVLLGAGFIGFGWLYLGVPTYIPVLFGIIAGGGIGLFTIAISVTIQRETSKENIGRISGIYNSISNTVVVTAPLIGGLIVSVWSANVIYLNIGMFLLIGGFFAMLFLIKIEKQDTISN